VIAVADPEEAARRFARFTGRPAEPSAYGYSIRLDRGGLILVSRAALAAMFPSLAIPALPFTAAYGIRVESLAATLDCLQRGGLNFSRRDNALLVPFPSELGLGLWVFVEQPSGLLWRRD
jgi:hypothetical protein